MWLLQSARLISNVEAEIQFLMSVKIKTIGKMFEQYSISKFSVNVILKKGKQTLFISIEIMQLQQ